MILVFKLQEDTLKILKLLYESKKSGCSEHTKVPKKRNIFDTIFVWILDIGIVSLGVNLQLEF